MNKRKRPTFKERTTPCECCGFPLSQKHHLFPFSTHGESEYTHQLCANCHDIYHLVERSILSLAKYGHDKGYSSRLIQHLVEQLGDDLRWQNVYGLTLRMMAARQASLGENADARLVLILRLYGIYDTMKAAYDELMAKRNSGVEIEDKS